MGFMIEGQKEPASFSPKVTIVPKMIETTPAVFVTFFHNKAAKRAGVMTTPYNV